MDEKFKVDESKIWFRKESGWPEEVPKNIDFPKMSLGDMLRVTAKKYPDDKVIWFLDTFMKYRELDHHVDALATALSRLGLKKGDVIALLLPNSFQYVISYYAAVRLGCIPTGLNPTYKPMEILHQLKITKAVTLIVLDALYQGSIEPILSQSSIKTIIATNIGDFLPGLKRTLGKLLKKIPTGKVPSDAHSFKELLKTPVELPEVKIDPEEDTATYIMTGGTTGIPKAAVLTHFNLVSNCIQSRAWFFKGGAGACCVGVLPLFHSFAMTAVMNVSIYLGGWMMLFPRPPAQDELCATIEKIAPEGDTIYCGAEILFKRLAEFPDLKKYKILGKFSLCVSGAGPLHRPVQEAFEKVTGGRLTEGYGLTETGPVVSTGPFWGKRKIGTIGLPFPGTDWKILDIETGTRELGIGRDNTGEICVAGPQVMKGYLDRPEETVDTLIEFEGKTFLRTGDIGYMDEDGQIVILDRKKQLIKYRGYSVYPKEVEELVGGHPSVSEVAAAGLPDMESGEIIKVWVVLKDDYKGKVSEDEILKWCKENMTHYKVPRLLEFRDELPKTLVGKVMRRELQEADPLWKGAKPR